MKKFNKLNNLTGWLVFLIAAFVYLSTIEPTASLWDCGEFIASAFKMQVGHPPGAPFFMILARVATFFAGNHPEHAARMINALSGLASAFTILFLFWTITHLLRKFYKKDEPLTTGRTIAILGSGLVGALAYTFTDSFWFSAVEGEVYATSSLFTAVVFWAILKWENSADHARSDRWLILIAYLMGLSIGVHLLNLLAIPAIVLVYYFRKYKVTPKGVILALLLSLVLLATMMYGIIQGVFKVSSQFELFAVNTLGLPYNTGVYLHLALLAFSLAWSIYSIMYNKTNQTTIVLTVVALTLSGVPFMTSSVFFNLLMIVLLSIVVVLIFKKSPRTMQVILTSVTMILIGYSSFAMLLIRANADPPMNENKPDNVFALISYIDREQYGDRPLGYGQYYNAPVTGVEDTKPYYIRKNGKYIVSKYGSQYTYDPKATTIFPRMYSSQADHIRVYKDWGKVKGHPVQVINREGKRERIMVPTFGENLRFFFSYQLGFMYWRYFMWNFAGRQNDIQGLGNPLEGNWISGIKFFDAKRLGPQENLPDKYAHNKGRNRYYMLPLLFGILGMIIQAQKGPRDFWTVMALFVMTGIAIVVYLNQTPNQPRERDYSYAGSFYAFSIWVGMGVMFIYHFLRKAIKAIPAAVVTTLAGLILVPGIMASENWDDHDRSGRYTARDLAYNYLSTCAKDGILFTNGDNDTFPLWYAQEVEGIRTDVRVINLMLFNTDWYIDQMKRKVYDSDPVPLSLPHEKYIDGTNNMIYLVENQNIKGFVDMAAAIRFVADDSPGSKLRLQNGEQIDYLPAKKFSIPVNREKVIRNGTVSPEDSARIVPEVHVTLNKSYILKSSLMVMDLLSANNWDRPVYYVTGGHDDALGLENYFQLEGFAYRVVPILTPRRKDDPINYGRIDVEKTYKNLMENFRWGRMNEPDVYLDYYTRRTISIIKVRNNFARLAEALSDEGRKDSAVAVIDRCMEILPKEQMPYDIFTVGLIEGYYQAGASEKGNALATDYANDLKKELDYYFSFPPAKVSQVNYEERVALQILQQIIMAVQNYDPGLKETLQKDLEDYYQLYIGKTQS
ncbi:MAG: DUF2723 domain-containing protein [Chlorobi bacterium]|nr:DUF2723 domain-containing protein [Chlorobiota bacterium]